MTAQQGEKLERDNQFTRALAKYRLAGSLLEELKKTHAEWQPAIVEYRSRKISESILRVQSKVGTQTELAATAEPAASSSPYLPKNAGPAEPSVEIGSTKPGDARLPLPVQTQAPQPVAPRTNIPAPAPTAVAGAAPAATPNVAAIKEATEVLQEKVVEVQADLAWSRSE